jgi:hypothetical protein
MGANIAGIYGAQIFRQDDKPRYRRGFSIGIAVLTVGLSLAAVRFVDDLWRRRRNSSQLQSRAASEHNSHEKDEKDEQDERDEFGAAQPSDDQPHPILITNDLHPVVPSGAR